MGRYFPNALSVWDALAFTGVVALLAAGAVIVLGVITWNDPRGWIADGDMRERRVLIFFAALLVVAFLLFLGGDAG